jgi:hypothetical protein
MGQWKIDRKHRIKNGLDCVDLLTAPHFVESGRLDWNWVLLQKFLRQQTITEYTLRRDYFTWHCSSTHGHRVQIDLSLANAFFTPKTSVSCNHFEEEMQRIQCIDYIDRIKAAASSSTAPEEQLHPICHVVEIVHLIAQF